MGMRSALTATQDHAFGCLFLVLGQTKYTVNVGDLFTQVETPQCQVLDTRPDSSDRCHGSWLIRRNVPWNAIGPQHGGSDKGADRLH
jgi:hypothetical protein